MITIQSVMLVALGVLATCLVGLLLVPAYYKRTVRLTTERLKRAMPMTEDEIRADKDRIRADYALAIHDLNRQLETVTLTSARQRVEINRRDAAISALEGEVTRMATSLEEHENARRVLEQTIMDRLPRVEQRLGEARKLLTQRDREVTRLSDTAEKQGRALEEMNQINAHGRDEIMRLNAALATRSARNRDGVGDAGFDGEVALRSEIEALRARNREQGALIARLQGLMSRTGGAVGAGLSGAASSSTGGTPGAAGSGEAIALPVTPAAGRLQSGEPIVVHRAEDEIARLRQSLLEAEAALRSSQTSAEAGQQSKSKLENEIKSLTATTEQQASEIARLKAAMTVYEDGDKNERGIAQSKIAMKARLAALQSQSEDQAQIIQRLRAEIAATNERAARQTAHLMEEMRKLGSGTYQTTAGGRTVPRAPDTAAPESRPSLSKRIAEPRVPPPVERRGGSASRSSRQTTAPPPIDPQDLARASGFLKALGGASGEPPAGPPPIPPQTPSNTERFAGTAATSATGREDPAAASGGGAAAATAVAEKASDTSEAVAASPQPQPARRGGLLDRITRIDSGE